MSLKNQQSGFTAVEIMIVLVVISVLGLAGYVVYVRQDKAASNESSQSTQIAEETAAPEIKSTDDLNKAEKTLDESDSNDDSSQLDAELNSF